MGILADFDVPYIHRIQHQRTIFEKIAIFKKWAALNLTYISGHIYIFRLELKHTASLCSAPSVPYTPLQNQGRSVYKQTSRLLGFIISLGEYIPS